MLTKQENFCVKIDRIREATLKQGFGGIEINSQTNFSYFTRGRGFIGLASVAACGSLLVTEDKVALIAENIEGERLYIEQLESNPMVELMPYPWEDGAQKDKIIKELLKGKPLAGENDMAGALFQMRTRLTEYDIVDYRQLCLDTAEKLEEICFENLRAGMSEYELAGMIAEAFWAVNIEPITILIAFDGRARKYRHPVPNGARLENYALISVCGRRNGLVSSVTRNVLLKPDGEFIEKNQHCADVMAAALNCLTVDTPLSQVFHEISQCYKKLGYEGEETYHHQGGLTGFIPREIRASNDSSHQIGLCEAYAFNPTIQGAKCEDTVVITEAGLENISYTGNFRYNAYQIQGKEMLLPIVYVMGSY